MIMQSQYHEAATDDFPPVSRSKQVGQVLHGPQGLVSSEKGARSLLQKDRKHTMFDLFYWAVP